MFVLIDRYIARLIFWPLLGTLVVSALILLMIRMAELFSLVLDEGGTTSTAFQILGNLVPQYLAFGIPLGLIFGVSRAFRGLALAGELDAVAGMGVSTLRLLKVPMLYAAGLAVITFAVVGYVQPLSVYEFERLLFDVRNGQFGFSVPVGEFTRLSDKIAIRVVAARNGGRDLSGVFLSVTENDGRQMTIIAERATLTADDDTGLSSAVFMNGTVSRVDFGAQKAQSISFASYDLPFKLPNMPTFRLRGEHERELTLSEQIRETRDVTTPPQKMAEASAGIYRRLAQVLVLFFLPMLGVALARPALRSTSEMGLIIALVLYIVYNEISLYGERLGFNGQADPLPVQVAPLLVFAALSVGLFLPMALRSGEPPMAILMRVDVMWFWPWRKNLASKKAR